VGSRADTKRFKQRKAEIAERRRMVEEKVKQGSLSNLKPMWDLMGMDASVWLSEQWWDRECGLREVDGLYIKPHLYWS